MSGPRLIGKVSSVGTQLERAEVKFKDDNHANTCVVGKGCYNKHYLDRYCIVRPFLDLYEGQKVPIVNAFCFNDDQDGQSYIICVNKALYFRYEKVALMFTFQLRASGEVVRNIPKQFEENSPFSISFTDKDLYIPFLIKGTTC